MTLAKRAKILSILIAFFGYFDATFDVFDVCAHRGVEILVDLNIPNSTSMYTSRYDLVIDNGTLEHCFNIGEALINTARLAKHSFGHVFHINPLYMPNHGFFDICPTFLFDFYHQNQFKIKHVYATGLNLKKGSCEIPQPSSRLNIILVERKLL